MSYVPNYNTVGASRVAALFNASPWESQYSMWSEYVGLTPPKEQTERMRMGLVFEGPILDAWCRDNGFVPGEGDKELVRNNEVFIHPAHPEVSATPDAVGFDVEWLDDHIDSDVRVPIIGEVKTIEPGRRKDWLEGVPLYYRLQVQQQLLVTKAQRGVLIAAFGFGEISHEWVDADPATQEAIVDKITEFMKRVRGELPPPEVCEHDATARALAQRQVVEKTVALSQQVRELSDALEAEERALRGIAPRIKKLKNQIRAAMGDATAGTFVDGTGWRLQTINRKESVIKATSYTKLVRITNDEAEDGETEGQE